MADDDARESDLGDDEKKEIAKWFLVNSPAGEINYVAKGTSFFLFLFWYFHCSYWFWIALFVCFFNVYIDLKSLLKDDHVYNLAAAEAFPLFNKAHVISVEMPNRTGDVSLCLL